ncbi:MAG: hypothetical protein R3F19_21140 [Verrucomicrobiales bacterium]
MAEVASEFLAEQFAPIPKDSGVKKFLSTENEKIHIVKGKLVWLASQSYLFRVFWELFLSERGGQEAEDLIGILEDFIGQHCTEWCGLGATEILVELLNLTGDDRNDVLSWRERHVAAYRVLDAKRSGEIVDSISLYNIVSAGEYRVEVGLEMPEFTQGAVIYGALVPWRGTWHWSGSQQLLNNFSPDRDAELRAAMLKENSSIAYRYCKEDADMARERQAEQHAKFLDFYKDDLVVFKDGRTLAASENQRLAASWADATASDVEQAMLTRGHTAPKMSFPPEFLEDAKGIAAFSNPEEGVEYCRAFDTLRRGLQKQGVDLLTDEIYVIQGVMRADACSVALMRRIVGDDGPKSIAQAFQITNVSPEIAFEYLLRRYKGVYFHTRYPCLTIVK